MSDIDDLMKEVAAKHRVALGRDDPLLILQTINEHLTEKSAKAAARNA